MLLLHSKFTAVPRIMWPFSSSPEVAVENNISNHDVVGYSIDAMMIVIVIIVILIWRWRRNVRRLRELESVATRLATRNNV